MDWLSQYSPMEIHWVDRWIQFHYNQQGVVLHGISTDTKLGPPTVTISWLTNSVLYLVQLQASDHKLLPAPAIYQQISKGYWISFNLFYTTIITPTLIRRSHHTTVRWCPTILPQALQVQSCTENRN
jgi:hypothetical protein